MNATDRRRYATWIRELADIKRRCEDINARICWREGSKASNVCRDVLQSRDAVARAASGLCELATGE